VSFLREERLGHAGPTSACLVNHCDRW
jgi:hypothetical protein